MKISKILLSVLQQLIAGQSVAASALRKVIANDLLSEGLLTVQTHGSRRTFRAIDADALKNFLQRHYEALRTIGDETTGLFETRS